MPLLIHGFRVQESYEFIFLGPSSEGIMQVSFDNKVYEGRDEVVVL